jgi:hypothetical protein
VCHCIRSMFRVLGSWMVSKMLLYAKKEFSR